MSNDPAQACAKEIVDAAFHNMGVPVLATEWTEATLTRHYAPQTAALRETRAVMERIIACEDGKHIVPNWRDWQNIVTEAHVLLARITEITEGKNGK